MSEKAHALPVQALEPRDVLKGKYHLWLLYGVILLGTALRFYALGDKSLWLDEITIVQAVEQDLLSALEGAKSHISAPPLDYLILHVTAEWCQEAFCLRFPAAMWGILSLAVAYRVGEKLLGRQTALVGTFLLSISPFHIRYSQEMKFYSILVLFTLLSVLFLLRALRRKTFGAWLVYALVMVVGVYAHSFVALVGLIEGIWLAGMWLATRMQLRSKRTAVDARSFDRNMIAFVLTGIFVVTAYTPWIVWDFLEQTAPSRDFATALSPAWVLDVFLDMVLLHQNPSPIWFWLPGPQPTLIELSTSSILGYLLLITAALGSLWLLLKRRVTALLLLAALAPLFTLWLDNAAGYWFAQRQVVFALPAYLLLAAYGIMLAAEALGKLVPRVFGARFRRVPLAVILGAIVLVTVEPIQANYRRETQNWRDAALLLRHQVQPGDQVFGWRWAWLPLTFYDPDLEALGIHSLFDEDKEDFQREVQNASGRIWYVRDQVWWQDREPFETWVFSDALATVDLGAVLVSFWHKGDVPPSESQAETQALLEEALAFHPTSQASNALGDIYMQQNQLDRAVAQYEQAVSLGPRWGMGYTRLGNAYRRQGRTDEAKAAYEKAIHVDPEYVGAHVQLGWTYEAQGQAEQALEMYQQATQVDPDSAWAQLSLGNAHLKLGHLTEAETAYRTVLQLMPDHADARMGMGRVRLAQGYSTQALDYLEEAVQLQPENLNWLLELANLYRESGYQDKASAAYKRVLTLDPSNQQATEALRVLEPQDSTNSLAP